MKKIILTIITMISFASFAETQLVSPTLSSCDKNTLESYPAMRGKKTITIPTKITLQAREALYGDPALWSMLYKIKIEFPVKGKKVCHLIDKAYLQSARSVGYEASKGRLIEVKVLAANFSPEDESIGEEEVSLKVRVNQATGLVTLE